MIIGKQAPKKAPIVQAFHKIVQEISIMNWVNLKNLTNISKGSWKGPFTSKKS